MLAMILVAFTMPPLTLPPSGAPPIVLPPPPIVLPKAEFSPPPRVVTTPPPASKPAAPYHQSPPGYHRHQYPDGRVIEHSDANHGNPAAHQGLPAPWPKYYGPSPPTQQAAPRITRQACPT